MLENTLPLSDNSETNFYNTIGKATYLLSVFSLHLCLIASKMRDCISHLVLRQSQCICCTQSTGMTNLFLSQLPSQHMSSNTLTDGWCHRPSCQKKNKNRMNETNTYNCFCGVFILFLICIWWLTKQATFRVFHWPKNDNAGHVFDKVLRIPQEIVSNGVFILVNYYWCFQCIMTGWSTSGINKYVMEKPYPNDWGIVRVWYQANENIFWSIVVCNHINCTFQTSVMMPCCKHQTLKWRYESVYKMACYYPKRKKKLTDVPWNWY